MNEISDKQFEELIQDYENIEGKKLNVVPLILKEISKTNGNAAKRAKEMLNCLGLAGL